MEMVESAAAITARYEVRNRGGEEMMTERGERK
jgi:hypothetical protein